MEIIIQRLHFHGRKPPPGVLKVNIDGAFVKETGSKGAVGVVIRNERGEILKMKAVPISLCLLGRDD